MFQYVLSVTFAVGLATAATISTTATCDGVTTVGTSSAMCNDGSFFAAASVSAFMVDVQSGQVTGLPGSSTGSASASFSGNFIFTVNGGSGNGFFYPCFYGSSDSFGASAEMSFAGIAFSASGSPIASTNCSLPPKLNFPLAKPFTFVVPQIVPIINNGSAPDNSFHGTSANETFLPGLEILFFEPSGNLLSNPTYTLVDSMPEPSSWSLLSIGLMLFLALPIRRMRLRGGFGRRDLGRSESAKSTAPRLVQSIY